MRVLPKEKSLHLPAIASMVSGLVEAPNGMVVVYGIVAIFEAGMVVVELPLEACSGRIAAGDMVSVARRLPMLDEP